MNETFPAVVEGELRPDARVDLLVLGGGFPHGEGLFETLALAGGRPVFLRRHLQRLCSGARELELDPVPDEATWRSDLRLLCESSGHLDLAARLFLFRDGPVARRCVGGTAMPEDARRPAAVGLVEPHLNGPRSLAHLKTLNYLVPRLAWRLGFGKGYDEVLFTTSEGMVLEGTRSTVFMVKGGTVLTPPLSLPLLPGVTREVLLEAAAAEEIPCCETPFSLSDLQQAEEAFLTASLRGVRPIRSVMGQALPQIDGPFTRRFQDLFRVKASQE